MRTTWTPCLLLSRSPEWGVVGTPTLHFYASAATLQRISRLSLPSCNPFTTAGKHRKKIPKRYVKWRKEKPGAQIVVPLSLGEHRDHSLVFLASLAVLDRNHLLFFEDFPYAMYQAEEPAELVKVYQLIPIEVDISQCLEQRMKAAESY